MKISHEFVDVFPDKLTKNTLYISMKYRTAAHLCADGCGNVVITPIRPARWQLYYDGQTVSLSPSIGNWGLPCKSHYWIQNDQIEWSYSMSEDEIATVVNREKRNIRKYFSPPSRRGRKKK